MTILDHCKLLHLLDKSGTSVFASELDWIILLWHLQTQCWVAYANAKDNEAGNEADDGRSLVLKMHIFIWVWHFVIQVFILVAHAVVVVFMHIVENWEGIMQKHSSI